MRIATYYLETGREVDIYLNDGTFTAQDAYLDTQWDFNSYPSWNDVSAKWLELSPEEITDES